MNNNAEYQIYLTIKENMKDSISILGEFQKTLKNVTEANRSYIQETIQSFTSMASVSNI